VNISIDWLSYKNNGEEKVLCESVQWLGGLPNTTTRWRINTTKSNRKESVQWTSM